MFEWKKLRGENKSLTQKCRKLQEEIDEAKEKIEKLRMERAEIILSNKELTDNVNNLKAKIREQTEADLILSTLKLIATALKGEESSKEDIDYHQQLLARMQAQAQAQSGQGGILGNLQLRRAFGGIF